MTDFFYLKLGQGNCLAKYWLNLEEKRPNIYNRPVAAIYFGRNTTEKIRELIKIPEKDEKGKKEAEAEFKRLVDGKRPDINAAKDFVIAGDKLGERTFITITHDKVYIFEPGYEVDDIPKDKYEEYDKDLDYLLQADTAEKKNIEEMKIGSEIKHTPKFMPVKIIKECEIADVPHVLATLPCNQRYTRGTCRKIEDGGAIQAIEHVLDKEIEVPEKEYYCKLIELLSPVELETLVFLILRNADPGLFVPAWRGGTQKDIDIICHNPTNSQIEISSKVKFKPEKSLTFSVKREKVKEPFSVADFTVAIKSDGKDDKILDAKWLLEQIKKQPGTKKWFKNSLNWVKNVDALVEEEAENETKN